jgi:hypothetical protein
VAEVGVVVVEVAKAPPHLPQSHINWGNSSLSDRKPVPPTVVLSLKPPKRPLLPVIDYAYFVGIVVEEVSTFD